MQMIADIVMAIIPYTPLLVSVWLTHIVYTHKPKYVEITIKGIITIKTIY